MGPTPQRPLVPPLSLVLRAGLRAWPGSHASPKGQQGPALEPARAGRHSRPWKGYWEAKHTAKAGWPPRGREGRLTQDPRHLHLPAADGPYASKCLAFIRGHFLF